MAHRVRLYEQGSPSVLRYEEVEVPAPGPSQVRIRQEASGVNFVDTMFRDGTIKLPMPFDIGIEGAGIVEAIGDSTSGIEIGDRVGYFYSIGGYTDERNVPVEALIKLPKDISAVTASAVMAKGLTAWCAVREVHRVSPGETILVSGAAGGVGSLVATWATSLGATVVALVGSPAKAHKLAERGISHVLDVNNPAWASEIRRITAGRGVDTLIELVGGPNFATSVKALRDGGTVVHIGNATGSIDVDQSYLASRSIRYAKYGTPGIISTREILERSSNELFTALLSNVFGEIEITEFALADARLAHEAIAARSVSGSIVLTP